jgi:CHASE2 domain-containing sensor protein
LGIQVPSDSVLAASTIDYADTLRADDRTLNEWFHDRVIVAGDCRPGVDRHRHPDGRLLPGCVGQAVAIDSLLSDASIKMPRWHETLILAGLSAAVGAFVGWEVPSVRHRLALLTLLAIITTILSLLALRAIGYLCNPLVPLATVLLASELAGAGRRLISTRHTSSTR